MHQARWRVCSLAARWIRRARPKACAWRTESPTLTLLLIFLSFSYPSKHPFPQDIFRIYVIISKNDPKEILEWPLRPRHRARLQRLRWILEPQDASKRPPRWPKRHQDASKRPQDASKRPQDASKTAHEAPETAPRGSKTLPRGPFSLSFF